MRSTTVVAFLRGVNLGSRQMKMAELKACCEALGLRQVKTILASGNVRFEAAGIRGLKDRLERALAAQFGYPVQVVLRTASEIDAMIASDPFGAVDPSADVARHVLLSETPIEPMPDLSALRPTSTYPAWTAAKSTSSRTACRTAATPKAWTGSDRGCRRGSSSPCGTGTRF